MRKILGVLLAMMMVLSPVNSLQPIQAMETIQESTIESNSETLFENELTKIELIKTFQEETNTVIGEMNIHLLDETLTSVELQDIDGNSFEDRKTETGAYVFEYAQNGVYTYQVITTKDNETTTSSFSMEVTEVSVSGTSEEIETIVENESTNRRASALSVAIDGLYEASVDTWELQSSTAFDYTATIGATFSDTATDKRVRITLPEGIRFRSYGVLGTPDSSGIQTELTGSTKDFTQAVISTPQKQEFYPSYNVGALEYQFLSGTETVPVSIGFEVDTMVYYGPKTFQEGFKVEVIEDGVVVQSSVKSITTTTKWVVSWTRGWQQPIAIQGSEDFQNYAVFAAFTSDSPAGGNSSYMKYIKKVEITDYYPTEMTLADSFSIGVDDVTEINRDEGLISRIIENKVRGANTIIPYLFVPLSASNIQEVGDYQNPREPQMKLTTYDGTVLTAGNPLSDGSGILPYNVNHNIKAVVISEDDPLAQNKLTLKDGIVTYAKIHEDYQVGIPYYSKDIISAEGSDKTNQTFEYIIPSDFEATFINFIKDNNNEQLGNIYYRTNKNSTLRMIQSGDSSIFDGVGVWGISKESVGLESDEYFTYVRAYVGTFTAGFSMSSIQGVTFPLIRGALNDTASSATITINSFASTDDGVTKEENSESSANYVVNRISVDYARYSGAAASFDNQATAGEVVSLKYSLSVNYPYTNTSAVANPKFCFVAPKNTSVVTDSIEVFQKDKIIDNQNSGYAYATTYSNFSQRQQGENEITCFTIDGNVGSFFDEKVQIVEVFFKLYTSIQAGGSFDQSSLAFFMADEGAVSNSTSGYTSVIADSNDIDNDGDTTELIWPVLARQLNIIQKSGMLIDTSIRVQGGEREPVFDLANPSTAVKFTPGTVTEYEVDMINNGTAIASELRSYLPVPKTGGNFGEKFQSEAFKWDLKISADPILKVYNEDGTENLSAVSNYILEYSSDAVMSGDEPTGTWTSTYSDTTTMIRVTNTSGMTRGERLNVIFAYEVAENDASVAASPEKLNAVQDFRPHYYYKITGEAAGYSQGTRVGVELVIGKISGRVFEDANFDGLYTAGETLISGKQVHLYQRQPDGTYPHFATVTTDASGVYSFTGIGNGDYKVSFADVLTADQSFTKKDIGNDETIDSDVTITGTDVGRAININPVDEASKNVNAGIINYNPTTLSAAINEEDQTLLAWNSSLQTGDRVVLTTTITPTNFDDIKASGNPIVWTTSDASVVSVSNGGLQGNAAGTATITFTIKDMFGNTASDSIEVTVTSNTAPTIETNSSSTLTHELGTAYTTDLKTLVTVTDAEDNPVDLSRLVVNGTVDGMTVGEYTINYEYTDGDGNAVMHSLMVEVVDTTAPTVTVANDTIHFEVPQVVTEDAIFTAAGVTISDASTTSWVINGLDALDLTVIGEYQTVGLVVTDAYGNVTTTPIIFMVEDTTAPTIELIVNEISYTDDVIVDETQFLSDVLNRVTDNGPESEIVVTTDFDTGVDFDIVGPVTVTITATDAYGNVSTEEIIVTIVSVMEYFIQANDFTMKGPEYNAAEQNGTLEDVILAAAQARAWKEHPRFGTAEMDVEISSTTVLPTSVSHGDEITVTIVGGDSIRRAFFSMIPFAIATPLVETEFTIRIESNIYTVNFYDCNQTIVSQDWILEGENAKPNGTYSYPSASYMNVQGNQDAYPVNCSSGFVIPNTGR